MSYKSFKYLRRKYKVYAKYKDPNHPAYLAAKRKADAELKRAKKNFECKLARNIKKDAKSFFAYVRDNSKVKGKINSLVDSAGETIVDDKVMSEVFNDYFATVFTSEDMNNVPSAGEPVKTVLSDVIITEETVREKLDSLGNDKAAGSG